MKQKKIIKQLMAIGVQRNDATAFARAYRKVMYAKREDLFPEIVKPAMPVVGTTIDYRVTPFRAVCMVTEMQRRLFCQDKEEIANRIEGMLSKEIARGLMHSGYVKMRIEEICGVGTQYTATVNVAMPCR